MPRYTLSTALVAIAVTTRSVLAQDPTTSSLVPLASKHFTWPNLVRWNEHIFLPRL